MYISVKWKFNHKNKKKKTTTIKASDLKVNAVPRGQVNTSTRDILISLLIILRDLY